MKLQIKIVRSVVYLAAFFALLVGLQAQARNAPLPVSTNTPPPINTNAPPPVNTNSPPPIAGAMETNIVTLTATIESQGGTNVSGGFTTIASPKKTAITTKQLLQWLAKDEFSEGNIDTNSFPSGAYLAVITTPTTEDFQVLTKNNSLLVDVSDVFIGYFGSNTLYTAKIRNSTGLYSPSGMTTRVATLVFDDSGVNAVNGPTAGVTIYLIGLQTTTVTDTNPSRSGVYTETVSATTPNAVGEGTYQGTPVIVTGSFGYTLKHNLTQ